MHNGVPWQFTYFGKQAIAHVERVFSRLLEACRAKDAQMFRSRVNTWHDNYDWSVVPLEVRQGTDDDLAAGLRAATQNDWSAAGEFLTKAIERWRVPTG